MDTSIKAYHIGSVDAKASLYTIDHFLSAENANALFEKFHDPEYPLTSDVVVKIFGKECIAHRRMGFFSDVSMGYEFAGQTLESQPLTKMHVRLLKLVNERLETHFNGILINDYRDGTDSLGAHADSKKGLSNGIVAAISLGASRIFRVSNKETKETIVDIKTQHNQLLVMDGNFQDVYKHAIPASKKVKSARISLTFRVHQ